MIQLCWRSKSKMIMMHCNCWMTDFEDNRRKKEYERSQRHPAADHSQPEITMEDVYTGIGSHWDVVMTRMLILL